MLGRLSLVHFLAGAIFLIAGPAAYALELVRAQRQPEPLHPLKVDWVDLVEVGLDVAGATIPVAKAGATAIKFEKGAFEVLDLSVGGRTAELEDDLLLIDSDARRLQDLKAQGRDLRTDPEARDVIDRLQRRMTAPGDNPYAFAARALFSRHGVYGTATVVSRNWAAGRFAKKMTRTLGVGPFTSEAIAGSKWGRLKRVSRLSRNLSDALTKAFFKKITKAIFDTVLAEKLKEIVASPRKPIHMLVDACPATACDCRSCRPHNWSCRRLWSRSRHPPRPCSCFRNGYRPTSIPLSMVSRSSARSSSASTMRYAGLEKR